MMKLYDITEKPLKIYGLAVADSEKRHFFRLPEEALERFPQYGYLGRRAVGGRVRFQTDAKKLYVKMTLAGTKEDINIPSFYFTGNMIPYFIPVGMEPDFTPLIRCFPEQTFAGFLKQWSFICKNMIFSIRMINFPNCWRKERICRIAAGKN